MLEVEVKVRATHDDVRPRLEAADADRLGAVRQVDTYFDAPHRDFAATDEALRLRRETAESGEEVARLTYKGPLVDDDSKTREEAETAVADAGATAAILASLGFEPAATVRKDRERYGVDDCVVALDAVRDLGEFVEVEARGAVAPGDDLEAARESAFEVLRELNLAPAEQIRTSYLGLLLAGSPGNDSR